MFAQEKTLSQDELKSVLRYNPSTGEFTWLVSVGRVKNGTVAGTISEHKGCLRRRIKLNGTLHYASRLAFLYMNGRLPEHCAIHKDRDTMNNSWDNLVDEEMEGKK